MKDLQKKMQEMAKNQQLEENSNEAQTDKLNLDFYKQELRKRDEYIKYISK